MKSLLVTSAVVALFCATEMKSATAAVSAEEAEKLKSTLTPIGAERDGNADGSVPAWNGGMVDTQHKEKYYADGRRPDIFSDEKPLFSITPSNLGQYGDKLSEGVKGLFAKYPDTFRIDVYKSHRTAAMPQWLYDNTYKNATTATIVEKGIDFFPQNIVGGVPFPIPKNGREVIWNHLLRWSGVAHEELLDGLLVTSEGKQVLTTTALNQFYYPFYDMKNATALNGDYMYLKTVNSGPAIRVGEGLVLHDNVNDELTRAWVYLTGQRRIRMLPNACCDTPSPASAGIVAFDEYYVFANKPSRFDWKIVGKKEMFIPYNSNRTLVPKSYDEILSSHHMNPDLVRWELHRVWVLEASLRDGQRHLAPRSTYYIDEDTWTAVLGERYDLSKKLWRAMWSLPVAMPDVPGSIPTMTGFYDLSSGAWYVANVMNAHNQQMDFAKDFTAADFTPESLSSEGVR